MKVRDLINILERVREVDESIAYARLSLGHGGSPQTMARKEENLREVEKQLEDLLDEEVPK